MFTSNNVNTVIHYTLYYLSPYLSNSIYTYVYTRVQLAEDAPELAGLLDDMNAKLRELNEKISPVWTFVNEVRVCV